MAFEAPFCRAIEIGAHGYAHENPVALSEEQERDVMSRSVELITKLTGRAPFAVSHDRAVYTAPSLNPVEIMPPTLDPATGKAIRGTMRLGVRPGSCKLEGSAALPDLLARSIETGRNPADVIADYRDGILTTQHTEED